MVPQTLGRELPCDSATTLLYLGILKTLICKGIYTPVFTAASFTMTETREPLRCPEIDNWVKKTSACLQWRTYASVTRKDEISSSVTVWMNLENIMLSKIRKTEEDKNNMILPVCGT